MRRAKIVATLGPATDDLATVQKLIKAGLNVARLNMSHGDHSDHKKRLDLVQSLPMTLQEIKKKFLQPIKVCQEMLKKVIRFLLMMEKLD